jgi:hypothetical protein
MADEREKDRRQHERHPVSFRVDYTGEATGSGQAADLSPLGCAVVADTAVSVKTYVKVELALSDGAKPLEIELAVGRWSHGNNFGIEFIAFGEVQKNQAQTIFDLGGRARPIVMNGRVRGGRSVAPGDEPRSIAVVGLSARQEPLVDVAPSWLTERESLVFERADLAAAIVVLDGRSRDAQGA